MDSKLNDTKFFSYLDEEIINSITSLPSLPTFSNIIPLSSRYLSKGYPEDEVEDAVRAVEFASQLGIYVSGVQRTVQADNSFYCIMDRVPVKTLDGLRLAFKLRHVILICLAQPE